MIEKALLIATNAHTGQVDKGGNPYILHPLAVAARVQTIEEKIVAILHDTVEDTSITLDDLLIEGFSKEIVDGVDAMTRRENETYMEFIHRAKNNPIARNVKIADILENMDLSRIPNPTDSDYSRLDRYEKALKILKSEA
jgi:(p)ppGpp synthase/HD superfamily hydrolase